MQDVQPQMCFLYGNKPNYRSAMEQSIGAFIPDIYYSFRSLFLCPQTDAATLLFRISYASPLPMRLELPNRNIHSIHYLFVVSGPTVHDFHACASCTCLPELPQSLRHRSSRRRVMPTTEIRPFHNEFAFQYSRSPADDDYTLLAG